MKTLLLSTALILALTSAHANPLTQLQTITVTDLQNALADANGQTPPAGVIEPAPLTAQPGMPPGAVIPSVTAGSDTRHGNCWAALIVFLQNWQATNVLPKTSGLALLQQKIFDDQQLLGKPLIPDYVVTQCALTFNDAQMNLAQIAGLLGIKAITLPKI